MAMPWGKMVLREEALLVEECFFGWVFKQIFGHTIAELVFECFLVVFLRGCFRHEEAFLQGFGLGNKVIVSLFGLASTVISRFLPRKGWRCSWNLVGIGMATYLCL